VQPDRGSGPEPEGVGQGGYEGDDYVDAQGRRMRVRFDPGNRFLLEGFASADVASGDEPGGSGSSGWEGPDWSWGLAMAFEGRDACYQEDEDCWKLDHRVLAAAVRGGAGDGEVPPLSGSVYQARFMRHLASPYVTLPTRPARKILVPFDFGFTLSTAGVAVRTPATEPLWDIEVIDARLALDFLRDPSGRNRLEIGVGTRYHLLVREWEDNPAPEHMLSPFTAGDLELHLESRDGFHVFNLRADAFPYWSGRESWGNAVDVSARYEVVLAALNDCPLSLVVTGAYRYREPAVAGLSGPQEVAATVGLMFWPGLD